MTDRISEIRTWFVEAQTKKYCPADFKSVCTELQNARNDIPYLLDRLAEAETEVERLQEAQQWVQIEAVEALYEFLQGEVPPELTLREPPKLSQIAAFGVIYYLQEVMHILPDKFEICAECGDVYDSWMVCSSDDGKNYCDVCLPLPTPPEEGGKK